MITKNYHTHTFRCHHARDTDRDYVEAAIRSGITTLGFSDHTPQLFGNGYVGPFRMLPETLRDYCDSLLSLREEYSDKIEILIGLECEYYRLIFNDLLEFLKDYPIDYLLLSHHCFGNEFDLRQPKGHPEAGSYVHSGYKTDCDKLITDYVNQEIEGIKTGKFSAVCHPDMLKYIGDNTELYTAEMRRLCTAAKEYDLPLEINLLGIRSRRHYPAERFWKIAGEVGNKVIFGFDAHDANAFYAYPEQIEAAEALAQKYKLAVVDTIELGKL